MFEDMDWTKMLGLGSLLTQGLGGAISAKGAYDSADASRDAYTIQASIARYNAQLARQQAEVATHQAQFALDAGQATEQNTRLRTAQVMGAQRASLAANGVDLGEGNANEILSTSAFMGERDALTVRDNAARVAWGYRVQGANALNSGLGQSMSADALQRAADNISPMMSAGGSLMSTAGSVAGTWYNMKKQGIQMPWETSKGIASSATYAANDWMSS